VNVGVGEAVVRGEYGREANAACGMWTERGGLCYIEFLAAVARVKNRIETRPAAAALSMRADRSQAKSKPCGLQGRIPRVRVSGCIGVARWQLAYVQADEHPPFLGGQSGCTIVKGYVRRVSRRGYRSVLLSRWHNGILLACAWEHRIAVSDAAHCTDIRSIHCVGYRALVDRRYGDVSCWCDVSPEVYALKLRLKPANSLDVCHPLISQLSSTPQTHYHLCTSRTHSLNWTFRFSLLNYFRLVVRAFSHFSEPLLPTAHPSPPPITKFTHLPKALFLFPSCPDSPIRSGRAIMLGVSVPLFLCPCSVGWLTNKCL